MGKGWLLRNSLMCPKLFSLRRKYSLVRCAVAWTRLCRRPKSKAPRQRGLGYVVVAEEATKTARARASAGRASAVAAAALGVVVVLVLKGRERRSWSKAPVRDRAGDLEAAATSATPKLLSRRNNKAGHRDSHKLQLPTVVAVRKLQLPTVVAVRNVPAVVA